MRKVLLMCVIALTVYSCSDERDEQIIEKPEKVEKPELENLKINNPQGTANKTASDSTFIGITPYSTPMNGSVGLDPETGTDPDPNDPELIPPGDIRPPKGGK